MSGRDIGNNLPVDTCARTANCHSGDVPISDTTARPHHPAPAGPERTDPERFHQQLVNVERRIVADFEGRIAPEVVHRYLEEAEHAFDHARIRTFVPVLVDRTVRRQLRSQTV